MSTTAPVAERPTPETTKKPKRFNEGTGRLAAILLSPTLLVLAVVVLFPIISALKESLFQSGQRLDENGFIIQTPPLVGLDNYLDIFRGETGNGSGTLSTTRRSSP